MKIKITRGSLLSGPKVILSPEAREEGPRRRGYCIYCRRFCRGATAFCETRVYNEAQGK